MAKGGLGKGLRALIPDTNLEGDEGVVEVGVDLLSPNPYQPRRDFDPEKLRELGESIKLHGIVQPLIVRRTGEGYQIVAGERRWRAARQAGLEKVPVIVRDVDDKAMIQIALIENLQRQDLNPIEEAEAYRRLIVEFSFTQEQLADMLGRSRPVIANAMRLLNLPADIQQSVSRETISVGHARALLALPDEALQRSVCEKVIREGLSVRETEELVKKLISGSGNVSRETSSRVRRKMRHTDPNLLDIEDRLKHALGTQVRILPGKKKGKIEIEFYSEEDLERILALVL
ncbi:MAG TPA: ParB/RepB/Spo0J family partition protein [Firmicutes bacterium]|nr:ParB/RepB/Spo0J family partition protein [Bacillota bacterium]